MTRKPVLWIGLAVISLASAAFSWRYFAAAFPLVSLDIRMDRQTALATARALAAERRVGPADFREAASFSLDETVQTFVELEGGGKPAFAALVGDRLYTPYRWTVRHFKEREKHEVTFAFAADGTANGFVERVPEDAPGAALSPQAAREIAESAATRVWHADLGPLRAVEQSQERRTGGRVDHTFVYERHDSGLGEGRYRLRLVVSGDTLTELAYFIKIPDAFSRRYEAMRSVNTAIGVAASLAFVVLYGVGGVAFGLFVLARQRWVIWRQPIVWGAIVALAQTAAAVNEWPLAWMQYDTALSTRSFVAQRIAFALVELMVNVALFSLSFMAAESLTRRAFPDHPQFWRIWSRQSAASRAVLGRTVAGYLLVPAFIAYEVALYFVATKWLGWWTPSEALFNPDVLAAYTPWFSAIAKSFQAGIWEESLFRAVPIAGAALVGDRFGNRKLWIAAAFIVQALIFGAGHAPYPTQPAYARPVELMLPSIGFGLLYLAFGLLPGIVLHFAFDAFWFGMPLFASTAAGVRLQQIMLVAMMSVPLWVVLARRASARRAGAVDAERNTSWRPELVAAHESAPQPTPADAGVKPSYIRWIAVGGAVAAIVWTGAVMRLPMQRYRIEATREKAAQAARDALSASRLGREWRFLPVTDEGGGSSDRFVWEIAGRSTYASLLGTYLDLPGWTVFVRTFEGDVDARAESWTVHLDGHGVVQRVSHELPESRPGASLDESAARALARRALTERFSIDGAVLEEVSATPSKLPARTDWTITFKDTSRTLPRGEARLSAHLAGDEIADARRFVFIPEEWERAERNQQTVASVVQGGGLVLAAAMVIGGAIGAVIAWSRRRFVVRLFLVIFGTFLVFSAARFVNGFPATMAALSTAQPLQLQLAVLIASGAVGLTLQAAAMGLIAGAVPTWCPIARRDSRTAIGVALALGMMAAAARALSALSATGPLWPSYVGASAFVPFIASSVNPLVTFLSRIALLTVIVAGANRASAGWTRRRVAVGILLVIVGGALGNAGSPLNLWIWIASAVSIGLLLTAVYVVVLRHDVTVVPIAAALMTTMGTLREAWARAYPGALAGSLVAIVMMWAIAFWWFRALERRSPRPTPVAAGL